MELSAIINEYRGDFEKTYNRQILPSHLRAMQAIQICRERECGEMLVACPHCGKTERKAHSCGHRSCPKCQNYEASQWLDRQRQKLLPVPYFLVTFTIPAQFRKTVAAHQRIAFECLFQAARDTLESLAANERYLGGRIGMTGVLHTHNRRLDFHPHVHFLVPVGCLDGKTWKRKRWKFLFPENALAKMFRGKLLGLFAKNRLSIPEQVPEKTWVVNCKRVGYGERALEYLSRYLYRGVIAERRIVRNENGRVTFLYREGKTKAWKKRTESGADFLRLVLQHVLPKGFRRARDYGFLHGNAKKTLRRVQLLLQVNLPEPRETQRSVFSCPVCGNAMQIVGRKLPPIPPELKGTWEASP